MARRILRGGIYWAKLDPTVGVLVVSIEAFNNNSDSAIAFAITSQQPQVKYPLVYELPKDLLPKPSWVKITQIRTLSIKRLGKFIARIEEADYQKIMTGFNKLCC